MPVASLAAISSETRCFLPACQQLIHVSARGPVRVSCATRMCQCCMDLAPCVSPPWLSGKLVKEGWILSAMAIVPVPNDLLRCLAGTRALCNSTTPLSCMAPMTRLEMEGLLQHSSQRKLKQCSWYQFYTGCGGNSGRQSPGAQQALRSTFGGFLHGSTGRPSWCSR